MKKAGLLTILALFSSEISLEASTLCQTRLIEVSQRISGFDQLSNIQKLHLLNLFPTIQRLHNARLDEDSDALKPTTIVYPGLVDEKGFIVRWSTEKEKVELKPNPLAIGLLLPNTKVAFSTDEAVSSYAFILDQSIRKLGLQSDTEILLELLQYKVVIQLLTQPFEKIQEELKDHPEALRDLLLKLELRGLGWLENPTALVSVYASLQNGPETLVENLPLSLGIVNKLKGMGIETAGELAMRTARELLRDGIGIRQLANIKMALDHLNLQLSE